MASPKPAKFIWGGIGSGHQLLTYLARGLGAGGGGGGAFIHQKFPVRGVLAEKDRLSKVALEESHK